VRTSVIDLSMQLSDQRILAGLGYTFFNTKLRDYSKPVGYDEFSGNVYDITQPLVHQPGERWEYGVSLKDLTDPSC
jgi:hypothetical protein